MPFGLPKSQWRYIRHWLISIVATEAAILALSQFVQRFVNDLFPLTYQVATKALITYCSYKTAAATTIPFLTKLVQLNHDGVKELIEQVFCQHMGSKDMKREKEKLEELLIQANDKALHHYHQ